MNGIDTNRTVWSTLAKWLKRLGVGILVLLLIGYCWLWWRTATASVSIHGDTDLGKGT